ncbi:MAG: hypothetical protein K2L38_09545 [Dysosmobacter sp.]|nr:hypothetical protein [Dysosmobacter sp.]
MSDKFYVGLALTGCADNGKRLPVTSVTLQADGERTATAGTYTGLDLYAVCPYATQEMAAAILVQAQGYQYQAFSMDSANLDPAAELGDGIDGGGLYGVISSIRDAGDGYPTISAPGEEELEDEYPYRSAAQRELTGDVATLRAFITRSLGEMAAQITTLTGRVEALTQKVDEISGKVTQLDSRVTALGG